MSEDDEVETLIHELYDACTDPAKGSYEEYKVQYLKNRRTKILMGIRKTMSPGGTPEGTRNRFPE